MAQSEISDFEYKIKLDETIQFNPLKTFVSVDANLERLNINV